MNRYIILMLMFSVHSAAAEAESWVKGLGHKEGDVHVAGIVTDSDHNAIIAGSFSAAKLDLSETHNLRNNGTSDIFLVKYDTRGEIIWATSFGGIYEDQASDIFIDREDNLYITGNFKSPSFLVGSTEIGSMWPENVYVAKFDRNGSLQWLKHSTMATQWAYSQGVYCDENMKVYFTGHTRSKEISFGDFHLQLNTTNNKGFYCRLDQDGNFEMAGLMGDPETTQYTINDISADGQGNIYLAGKKTIHTEPDPITWSEYRDVMFFSKTDPAGTLIWTVEDTAFHRAEKIEYDLGSLYVLGSREEYRTIFNGGTIDTTSRCYYGSFDVSGKKLWDKSITGALGNDLFVSDHSILITGGLLLDHLDLDAFHIARNSDSSSICPIYQDIFYLESSKSGTIRNLESISGSLEDLPTGIWLAGNGDLLYTGTFESARLTVVESEVYNDSELTVFQHVSGIYYDRRVYSFLARHAAYAGPAGRQEKAPDPFLVYPNPSGGLFTIDPGNMKGAVRIQVHDMSGKMIFERGSVQMPFQVNLSDRPEGIYILSITGVKSRFQKPVMIIR